NMWSAVLSADDLVQDVKTSIPIRENVLCFRLPLDSDSYDYQANAFVDGSVNQINAQSSIMPDSNHCFSGSTDFTGFPIGSRTFETWIRCGMDAWGKTLLSYGDVSRSEHPNEGGDAWIIRNPEALQVNQMSTQINVADGQWHHLAIVTEVTAGTEPGSNTGKDSVYLDGVLKYSGNSQQVNQIANQPFLIGSGYWDDNEQVFQGQLKNAKLWLTPRSAAQIADSYQLAPFNAQQEAANGLLAYWTFTQGGADFGPALPYGITRYSKDVAELANDDELVASETPVLTVTTELMENYKHAQVMEQQHAFQALQTAEGHALFFSIGTDNTFYVTIETPGSKTGWNKINLSGSISQSALEKSLYQPSLFRVAQDVTSGAINIVLVLGGPLGDYVYTAWNLSNNDATWNEPLTWQYQKFDAPVVSLPMVKVHDVQLLESAPSDFLVVDIVLPVIESGDLYRRYFLDLKPGADTVWKEHDLALDFDNAIYSAIGKRAGETLEGIYTLGAVVDRYKLIYTPLIADASNTPNPASELLLPQPEGTALSSYAIALAPKGSTGETNLFVAGNKQLFFFASNQQQDGSTGQAVDLPAGNIFMNVSQLRTHTTDTHVFVWGLNQQGSLFYTQCALGQELEKQAWSTPGIILSGVSMAANYLNSANQSHVLFAYNTANQLLQLTQDGETPNWAQKTILLPAMDTNDVIELNTYTSHVVVTDGNRLPKAGVTIAITATTAVPVYVNDIYTILSPALPLNITTDSTGVLTIIQETPDLSAVGYRFKIEEVEPQLIN
ncbi:MAG: LamG-like jellyroll fold domain-containing protein, partial [Saprospiraceae bacterium]